MLDSYMRSIDYMRVSITDRCNLRCNYCMPEEVELQKQEEILQYEEIIRICNQASELGIKNIKITGGEPFIRKDAITLMKKMKELPKIEHITLTTNGVLLEQYMDEIKAIPLEGINISLDTLKKEKFEKITGKDEFDKVWNSIEKSVESGIPTKINCVIQKGLNDTELINLVNLAVTMKMDVRFIELMPIGYGKAMERMSGDEIYKEIKRYYPDIYVIKEKRGNGPATYIYSKGWKGNVGFIDAVSHKFCSSCNRLRLTADGFLKPCLCYGEGMDLKTLIRQGAGDKELRDVIKQTINEKPLEHNFLEAMDDKKKEKREMYRIGG